MFYNYSIQRFHFYLKRVARESSTQTYFFLNQKNKRQSAFQSRALFAPVVLKERSAWTTRSKNKSLTEYGQAPRLHSEALGKDLRIAKQGESIALMQFDPCILLGEHPKKSQQL